MVTATDALIYLLNAVWFILPAYIANMAPAIFSKAYGRYRFPVDFGRNFSDKRRIFGDGKTWNGIVIGSIFGGIVGLLQGDFVIGIVLGFGALFGDLVKSFFKRRMKMERGKMWFPFDQIDFILGAFLFYGLTFWEVSWGYLVLLLILTPGLHLLVNLIGFKLKLKEVPW